MPDAAALRQFCENRLPEALEMLRGMVGINSWTNNPEGVNALARYTSGCFAPLGFSAEHVPSTNSAWGDHLVLTRAGTGSQALALVSHLDTVFPPEEEERNRFHWSVEGDRIFGPGTHDIKGGTVMIWLVLAALQAQALEVFESTSWQIFLNSSEEMFSPDFGDVCRTRFLPGVRAALVFESEGRLGEERLMVVARKGRGTWRAQTAGRGAHAGVKHAQGANAILELAGVVEKIARLTDYARDLTFNVGTISGGTVLNRVPHEAVAEGEFRAFEPHIYAAGKAALLALNGPGAVISKPDGFRVQVQVDVLSESRPWPRNPGTEALAAVWVAAGESLGMQVGVQERGGLSDGNLLWDALPTLDGLGPWGDNDHCSERSADGSKLPEFVERSSFVPKAVWNSRAILDLLQDRKA